MLNQSNFLGDYTNKTQANFARKRYEEYLRENKPQLYNAIQKNRSYLKKRLTAYPPNQRGNKHKPFRNKYNKNKYSAIGEVNNTSLRGNMSWLGAQQKRNAPMQNLRNPLPNLQNAQRGVSPLPSLQPTKSPALPDLAQINKPSFDVIASKHDGRTLVNPVKDTFARIGEAKPVSRVIVPKTPKVSGKDTSKMLRNLGIAGVVSGGVLGAYGLKKYADSRRDKRR